jgi:hypothetical protein
MQITPTNIPNDMIRDDQYSRAGKGKKGQQNSKTIPSRLDHFLMRSNSKTKQSIMGTET